MKQRTIKNEKDNLVQNEDLISGISLWDIYNQRGNFRYVNNELYRDYRKDSGMGEDLYGYSNIYKFKL